LSRPEKRCHTKKQLSNPLCFQKLQHDVLDNVQVTVKPILSSNQESFERLSSTMTDFQSNFETQTAEDQRRLEKVAKKVEDLQQSSVAKVTEVNKTIEKKFIESYKMQLEMLEKLKRF